MVAVRRLRGNTDGSTRRRRQPPTLGSGISPVFQQIQITSDQERMNHIVPAETFHDGLDRAGLEVMGGGAGQIKRQQSET